MILGISNSNYDYYIFRFYMAFSINFYSRIYFHNLVLKTEERVRKKMSKKPDLRAISSVILDADGDFDEVHILGGLDSRGSLNAKYVDVKGSIKLQGSLWAVDIKVKGGVQAGADIIADGNITIHGGIDAKGKIKAKQIEIFGGIDTGEDIEGNNVSVRGGIKSKGNVKAVEILEVVGGVTAEGNIIAGEIISVGGFKSNRNVKAIGRIETRGEIEVEGDVECSDFTFKIGGPSYINGRLQADRIKIELDEDTRREAFLRVDEIVSPNKIEIDYVIAERIICPKIKAGENCRIGETIDKSYQP